MKKFFNTFNLQCKFSGFSLVELMISLVVISLITAAMAPVITKKLTSETITIGSFGGGGGGGEDITCPAGLYIDMNTKTCEVCPAGFECDGANKIPCPAGTYSLNRQSECTPCEDGYYSLDGATQCLENTAQNCAEKSKVDNVCLSCDGEDISVDGNCVSNVPVYTLVNSTGADITESSTELTKDENYWQIKIKSSGTLVFTSIPTNLIDVFVVGGGAGGNRSSGSTCSASAGGGGNYSLLNNVVVYKDMQYPIVVGSGATGGLCVYDHFGETSSGFGIFAYGGVSTGNHSICPFNESSCELKYGETGTSSNQIANTGNGGASGEHSGMSGVVLIRGKIKFQNNLDGTIPSYTFYNTSGSDETTKYTALNIAGDYWYLKYSASGRTVFSYLPDNLIDVFVVGGGAGGVWSSNSGCSASAGGGGTYSFLRNIYIARGLSYPISIGSGTAAQSCSVGRPSGGTSSGFGIFSRGGIDSAEYSICPFGEATCAFKYGNVGSATNQNNNTGNGGASGNSGMSGTIIIRGKKDVSFNKEDRLPIYKLTNSDEADLTNAGTSIRVTDTHWYLEIVQSGNLKFDSIKNDKIDVFLVGGGAGGVRSASTGCSASAGGGGNFNVLNNVDVASDTIYPIVIGSGAAGRSCSNGRATGGATSGFDGSAAGGSGTTAHSVCLFDGTDCTVTYGNKGSSTNQFQNTGNGGASGEHSGMNGVVIIRGTL